MGDKIFLVLFLASISALSQVGINTTNPVATLDVNGTLAIRAIPEETVKINAKDSIISMSTDGMLKTVTSNDVVNLGLPSCVKGNFATASPVTISLITGTDTIPFDNEDFDLNNDFDTTNHEFTASNSGIYQIYVQVEISSAVAASTDFGVSIRHNGTIVATANFANVHVLGTNVTPPYRSTSTIIQVNANDTVSFSFEGDIALSSIDLDADEINSFFTINQIR